MVEVIAEVGMLSALERKATGAYYTSSPVARFLATWAIRTGTERVLEPCCGDGVFVRAACTVTAALGGPSDGRNVTAVELDATLAEQVREEACALDLHNEDFFSILPDTEKFSPVDVVIGNPPFVRYHRFTGSVRDLALERARSLGVHLSGLSSAWAPFLVHTSRFLRANGRMAMVAPYEITYAIYARPVVRYLASRFSRVTIVVFREPLFPDLSEKTVLLLCEGFGGRAGRIEFVHRHSIYAADPDTMAADASTEVDAFARGTARPRLLELPHGVQDLYARLAGDPRVCRLGDVASLTIGYVTGDNRFFHLSRAKAAGLGLPEMATRIAVRRGSDLAGAGLALTASDAEDLAAKGENLLLTPDECFSHPRVQAYLRSGEAEGASTSFKSRVRPTWWKVPGVKPPDMFLSVFGHSRPLLVANEARIVATNSVLVLTLKDCTPPAPTLAAASVTSLALLSAEVEGHHLGAGALKFEPFEARQWLLPARVQVEPEVLSSIDAALRAGNVGEASTLADRAFLSLGLRLSADELASIRHSVALLQGSRKKRPQRA